MDTITIEEAEARLAELAHRVEQGETIVVTRDGRPVLDLVPHKRILPARRRPANPPRSGGVDLEAGRKFLAERGITKVVEYISPDFDDPLPEDFLITPERDDGPR